MTRSLPLSVLYQLLAAATHQKATDVVEGLGESYTPLYSPRSKEENAMFEHILRAAVKYAAGNLLK